MATVAVDVSAIFSGISAIGVIGGLIGVTLSLKKDRREVKEARANDAKKREETIKAQAETWTNLTRDVGDLKKSVEEINQTLGNGAYKGIKADIATIKNNCTCEMATLKEQVTTSIPRIKELEDRMNGLRKTDISE